MSSATPTRAAVSLSQLTQHIGNILRARPELAKVWVVAELSDVRTAGGHCYLELVEKNDAGMILAKMRANIWSSTYQRLHAKFSAATGRPISSGIKAMVCGAVTHHNVHGLSFNITDIDPSYTLGDIERLRREILERLKREGVADYNRSLTLTPTPQKIAVISAAGAAGYGDFVNQLQANTPGYIFYPHLYPAVMQGERTAQSVIAALEEIAMAVDFWDCVIIIRGGGATTDLTGFDNLELARAVATFPLPVIVGIGHERDFTVLDYLANVRCKTPTAVAEFLVDTLRRADMRVANAVNNIIMYARDRLSGEQRRLQAAASLLPVVADAKISSQRSRLQSVGSTIPMLAEMQLQRRKAAIDARMAVVASTSGKRISAETARITAVPLTIARIAEYQNRRQNDRLLRLGQLLDVLNPQATLRRGYSITRVNGKAVSSVAAVAPGDIISTTLADGTIDARTISTDKN